jgi:hypothetical protein
MSLSYEKLKKNNKKTLYEFIYLINIMCQIYLRINNQNTKN